MPSSVTVSYRSRTAGLGEVGPERGRGSTPRAELWLYSGTALSYVVCGSAVKQILVGGAARFVLFVWLVPVIWGCASAVVGSGCDVQFEAADKNKTT